MMNDKYGKLEKIGEKEQAGGRNRIQWMIDAAELENKIDENK